MEKTVKAVLTHDGLVWVLTDSRWRNGFTVPLRKHGWKRVSPVKWVNHSTKAALQFRRHADRKAREIFDRILIKSYAAPLEWPLPSYLDPLQKEGVQWALTRSRSYLAHAPGAGKTCEAVTAALMLHKPGGQALFIVPPTLTTNWVREVRRWAKAYDLVKFTCQIVPESKMQQSMYWGSNFVICPDSMLTKPWVYEALKHQKFDFVAVDEASRFKELSAQRTLALFGGKHQKQNFAGLTKNARRVVLLDGSPMPNRPAELWTPVIKLAPEVIDFMDFHDYGVKYCNARFVHDGYVQSWDYSGSSNEKELHDKLASKFMHFIPESKLNHPERRRSLIYMNEDVRSRQQRKWEAANLSDINFDDIIERDTDRAGNGNLARFRRELGLRKVDWVVKYVKERLEQGEAVLLFAWHREVIFALDLFFSTMKGPVNHSVVMGGTAPGWRERSFDRFQSGEINLIIGNIASMGRGHNLQRATRAVFAEWSWSDETNKQCEKRISRRGNAKKYVKCDYIVCPDSMDEPVLRAVMRKVKTFKKVIGE